jgi:hypothetical protein
MEKLNAKQEDYLLEEARDNFEDNNQSSLIKQKLDFHKAKNVKSYLIEYELSYPRAGYMTDFRLTMKRVLSHRGELELKYIVTATRLASCD